LGEVEFGLDGERVETKRMKIERILIRFEVSGQIVDGFSNLSSSTSQFENPKTIDSIAQLRTNFTLNR
jgi:hypothetical protein